MKKNSNSFFNTIILLTGIITLSLRASCQTAMPEILNDGTLEEQMSYIENRTRIYENYRAIREDMFQKIKDNALDSLVYSKSVIRGQNEQTSTLMDNIDSLTSSLASTKNSLEEVTATKNSIRVMGLEINKVSYNVIMWLIIASLITLLGIGFIVFKRTMVVSSHTKKELEQLKKDFDDYRQATRIAREEMSMAHFNELKKLRGH